MTEFGNSSVNDSSPDCASPSPMTFQLSTVIFVLLEAVILLFILIGNMMVLVAVGKFESLRTGVNMFVVSLAVSDLTVAVVALPLHIAIYIFPSIKALFSVCMLRYCVLVVSCGSSAFTLMLISLDRFIAIQLPYRYPTLMNKRRSKMLCCLVWLYTVAYGSLPLLGWNRWHSCVECTFTLVLPPAYIVFILGHIIIIVVIIGIINWKLFRTANDVAKMLDQQIKSVSGQWSQQKTQFVKNRKAAVALALVFGAYSVSNLPFALFTLWEIYVLGTQPELAADIPKWFHVIRLATTVLSLVNSGMNPIIYHRRMPEFRAAFRKLLGWETDSVRPAGGGCANPAAN